MRDRESDLLSGGLPFVLVDGSDDLRFDCVKRHFRFEEVDELQI
jgi:hypothetical protein